MQHAHVGLQKHRNILEICREFFSEIVYEIFLLAEFYEILRYLLPMYAAERKQHASFDSKKVKLAHTRIPSVCFRS